MGASPAVTVIVPTLNRLDLLKTAITTFRAHHEDLSHEIVVVDNGSDGSAEWCQAHGVETVIPEDPMTFGESNNAAAKDRKADYLLMLNNDTVTTQPFVGEMIKVMEARPRCVLVGAKIVRGDGKISHAGVEFAPDGTPFHTLHGTDPEHEFVNFDRPVNAVTAACWLVRRDTWEKLHGFDLRFENNYEDVDFCLKARERDMEIWYAHKAKLTHLENQTRGEKGDLRPMLQVFHDKWVRTQNFQFLIKFGHLDLDFDQRRLNLGCGTETAPGYVNIDIINGYGVDIARDVRKGLPFDNLSVGHIYIKNLVHLLSGEEVTELLLECTRVLRTGGQMTLTAWDGVSGDPCQKSVWTKDSVKVLGLEDVYEVESPELQGRLITWKLTMK